MRLYIEPTVILVSTRTDEVVLENLDPEARNEGSDTSTLQLPYLLDQRPAPEFAFESAKSKLAGLRLQQEGGPHVSFVVPGDVVAADGYLGNEESPGRQEQLLRLAGWVDMESRLTVNVCTSLRSEHC